ncbi:MAG: hypothetical protein K1X64_19585, partial [Myxococcaceae bacterium]|nr:hypothetical protein [Myxococcaceae bacterium]
MKPVVHQYEDKLLEFAYGELSAHEESAVSAHVQTCAKCSQALAGIKSVRASMRQLPIEAVPEAGLDSLLAYAEQAARRQGSQKSRSGFSRWVGGLSAVAALGLVAYVTVVADLKAPDAEAVATAAKKAEIKSAREYGEGGRQWAQEGASPSPVAAPPVADKAAEVNGPSPQNDGRAGAGGVGGKAAAKPSTSRREAVASALGDSKQGMGSLGSAGSGVGGVELAKEQKDADLRLDFGNATARGGREPSQVYLDDAKKKKPSKKEVNAPAEEKVAAAPTPKISKLKEAPLGLSADSAPVAPAAAAPAPAQSGGAERQESMGLSVRSKPSAAKGSSFSTETAADDEAYGAAPAKGDSAAEAEKKPARVATLLEQARVASTAGDRQSAVDAAFAALKSGATGSQRSEALKRLCDAFDASGDGASADTYCGLLLKEFPGSAEAKAVISRREQAQERVKAKAKPTPANA